MGSLALTERAPSVFGQVAAELVCVPLESAEQALEEGRQRFVEGPGEWAHGAARSGLQPSCCAPFRCSRQCWSLICKRRIMFHLLLGAAVVYYFVRTCVARSSRATTSLKAPGHARTAGNALPFGGAGCW